jgi:hypothetical protein
MPEEPMSGALSLDRIAPHGRRWLPWIGAAVVLGVVFLRISARDVIASFRGVNAPAFLLAMLIVTWVVLLCDALATTRVFRAVGADVTFGSILAARASSYLLGVINYHAGQAHLTYLLARIHKVPLARITGGTLLGYATILGGMVGLATITLLAGSSHASWANRAVYVSALTGAAYLATVAVRPSFLQRVPVVGVLFEVGAVGHLRLLLWRVPHLMVLLLEFWLAYRFFEVDLPLTAALVDLPIVLLVSALPITPMGIGTRELAAVSLLAPFALGSTDEARAARIVAAGGALVAATVLCQTLIGLAFARRSARLVSAARAR